MITINYDKIVKEALPNYVPQGYFVGLNRCDIDELIKNAIKNFLSYENVKRIIITYKSFTDRSCPGELIKKTIIKLKEEL